MIYKFDCRNTKTVACRRNKKHCKQQNIRQSEQPTLKSSPKTHLASVSAEKTVDGLW